MIETSTIFNPLMPFIGLTDYNFVYDVSYPIMVQIIDRGFENPSLPEGYSFQFALEVNIRNNEPLNTTNLPAGAASYQSPLLCNVNQRNSGDITINVVDALTNQPIDDAIISFTVGERDCVIGTISSAGNNVFKFPTGAIGALNVRKSGYLTYAELFNAQPGNARTISVRLEPFRERKIELKNKLTMKMPVVVNGDPGYEWKLTSPAPVARLQQGDQAIIMLTRVGLQGEEPLTIVAKYEPNEDVNISLVPGNYRIDINVIKNFEPGKNFTIPSGSVCWRNPPLFLTKDCKTIEAIVFDESMPIAALSIDEDNWLWQVTKEKLDSSKKITFYAVGPTMTMVEKHTDLGELANYDNYTISYRPLFEPEFS